MGIEVGDAEHSFLHGLQTHSSPRLWHDFAIDEVFEFAFCGDDGDDGPGFMPLEEGFGLFRCRFLSGPLEFDGVGLPIVAEAQVEAVAAVRGAGNFDVGGLWQRLEVLDTVVLDGLFEGDGFGNGGFSHCWPP